MGTNFKTRFCLVDRGITSDNIAIPVLEVVALFAKSVPGSVVLSRVSEFRYHEMWIGIDVSDRMGSDLRW